MEALLYSPRLPEDYSRPSADGWRVGVGAELAGPEYRALWNLYWLSDAAVDSFVGDWANGPRLNLEMLSACGVALTQRSGDAVVGAIVLYANPQAFVEHVLSHDHRHLAPYRLAGKAWVAAIRGRSSLFRGVLKTSGTVVYASFGRASLTPNVTTPGHSAKIMPLASPKS